MREPRSLRLREEVEDVRQQVGCDPYACITHAQDGFLALSLQTDRDVAALFAVLGGIAQQVHDHLLQPRRVAVHPHGLCRSGNRNLVLALRNQ